jgi:hypothetical protein
MATQLKPDFRETRSERLVVLVSPTEKRAIAARARDAKLSVSDFVRASAQNDQAPTDAEKAMLQDVFAELAALNAYTDTAMARLEATNARGRAYDEQAHKARLEAEWTRDGVVDWPAIRAVFSGAGFGA